jgi:hypothetical protein
MRRRSRPVWKTGHRVGDVPVTLECATGHTIRLDAHTTVPPCPCGKWDDRCGSVTYKQII